MKKAVVDEEIYPENYRKSNHVKGNNFKTPDPFVVARIVKFREDSLGLIFFLKLLFLKVYYALILFVWPQGPQQ